MDLLSRIVASMQQSVVAQLSRKAAAVVTGFAELMPRYGNMITPASGESHCSVPSLLSLDCRLTDSV
jgi:hypothetical protein